MTTLYQTVNGAEVTTSGEPVGLVLDKSRVGEELVTNGTFDTDTSGWIIEGTGATFESVNGQGVLTYGSGNAYANHYIPSVIGEVYNLQFDVISGGGGLSVGGDWDNIVIDSAGHYSLYMTATSTASLVRFYTLSGSLTIDKVSVRQVDSVALGSELVTNGDAFTGASGTTPPDGASNAGWYETSDGTYSVTDGVLTITNGTTGRTGFYWTISVVEGATYEIVWEDVTGGVQVRVVDFFTPNDTDPVSTLNKPSSSNEFFVAPASTLYVAVTNYSLVDGDAGTVGKISIKEVKGTHAKQPTATSRPTFQASPNRLELDLVDDSLLVDIPTGGWDGYMTVGTDLGTATYGVSLPEGNYELGGDYFFGNTINNVLFREGEMQPAHRQAIEQIFVDEGAKASYGDVTDFTRFWRGKNITEFPLIDTSSGTNFTAAWRLNNLTTFPLIDTSNGTTFRDAWLGNNLTSFPLLDASNVTNFQGAWYNNNLSSFPLLDTSSGTNFSFAWHNNNLTSFPLLDVSSGTNFYFAWWGNDLTSFPLIDTSSGTNFSYAWTNNSLTSFPLIDTSSANSFNNTWRNNSLTSFPMLDASSVSDFYGAWRGNNLASFPLIDTSSGTIFQSTWHTNNLTSFPLINTSNGTNFREAWYDNNLTSFPLLDVSSGTNFSYAWYSNNNLTTFPANMFDNCLATNFQHAFSGTNLSQESIDGILVSIESNGTSNGTFYQSGGSAPSSVGESAITALRARGWTVTVTGGF